MASPSHEGPPASSDGVPPRVSKRRTILAVLLIVVIVLAAVLSYTFIVGLKSPLAQVPAHVTARLANGTTLLDVPLMTLYTAPAYQNHGFSTNVSLSMSSRFGGPSTSLSLRWGNVTGTAEPVRFALAPTIGESLGTAFVQGPENGFLALPAGNCTQPGCVQRWGIEDPNPGDQSAYHEHWLMNYSVVRMAATVDGVSESWIQVNYSLEALAGFVGDPLPAANVTLPSAADLSPAVLINSYNMTKGQTTAALVEVHSMALPYAPFRHTLPLVAIDAGVVGNLTASLTSEFDWGPTETLWLGWSITAAHDGPLTATYSIDLRFGSPMVVFS